ncbi:MAG: murein L,D-transpeptidase catalytic domain family protein [Bacillota bacterium]
MTIAFKQPPFSVRFRTGLLVLTLMTSLAACAGDNNSQPTLPDETESEQPVSMETTEMPSLAMPDATVTASAISESEQANILAKYDHLDPQHIVPTQALIDALIYFDKNKSAIKNQNYLSIINFAQSSKEKRFYIINMSSGSVWAIHTAHGKGSDPDHDGYANSFSNAPGSNKSSLGYYLTGETYQGSHGLSLRLDGLSSTNSNARSRAIVIHGASYVQEASVIQGRSWGCPAVTMGYRDTVINALKGKSLIYAVVDKGGTSRSLSTPNVVTTPTQTATATPLATTSSTYQMAALAWDSGNAARATWSQYLQNIVLNDWSSLLKGANDMASFCPKYSSLNNNQRANVWAQLFVAMARFESGYNPLARMQETTMGTDPVTKKPVYSEGLLQLSYQDVKWAPYCKMDWSKDKNLSPTSPLKTILDPYINLHCGVGIMADQVKRKGLIAIGTGAYWAVLKTNSKYNKLASIKSMVKNFPLCN